MTGTAWRIVPALFIAGLSALILVDTADLAYWSDYSPGPAFGPRWVGLAGLFLAVLSIAQDLRTEGAPLDLPSRRAALRVGAALAALLAFAVLIPRAGMLIAAIAATAFLLLAVLRRPLLPSALTVLLTVALLYGVFVGWLGIPIPKSPLGF